MSTKSLKNKKSRYQEIDDFFSDIYNSEHDYELIAKVMTAEILNDIKEITEERDITRKGLAELIGTSASYLTQLYRGNKLLNFITLAKFKKVLNVDIEVRINREYSKTDTEIISNIYKHVKCHNGNKWEVIKMAPSDYSSEKYNNDFKEKLIG